MITREEVLKALDYDAATGIFIWKISHANNIKAGTEAVIVRKNAEKLHGYSPNHGSTRPL